MKQILQNLKNGEATLVDAPCPRFRSGFNLIQTSTSLISVGTERMLVDFGKGGMLAKAKQQPVTVRRVNETAPSFIIANQPADMILCKDD